MSYYYDALSAMINVAGGIVPDESYLKIRNSAERALKRWIQEIVNQPIREPAIITDLKIPVIERRSHKRAHGPAFRRLPPVSGKSEIRAI